MARISEPQRAEISSFLRKHTTLSIATLDNKGQQYAASLFYANDDTLNLYWVSDEKSMHSQNLERYSRAAVTIHRETWDWREIQGVQMTGQARRLVAPVAIDQAGMLYRAKFPFANEFEGIIAQSSFYIFSPAWIRWIDNSKGFGAREDFDLP